MSKDLIAIDNAVVNAAYELSTNEQRLLFSALAQIPKQEPVDAKRCYYISREDFIRAGVRPNNIAREIKIASKDLMKKTLLINTELGELEFHWFSEVLRYDAKAEEKLREKYPNPEDYDRYIKMLKSFNISNSDDDNSDENTIVRLIFSEQIMPFIADLKKSFTQFDIEDIAGFSSSYSIRIYQAMMQFKSTGYRRISITDLRYMLVLGNKYKQTKDLKVRIIDTAIQEINKSSPYTVKYKMIKTGRKFTHVEFSFKPKVKLASNSDNSASQPQPPQKLTAKAADMFSKKLCSDDAFGGRFAGIGELKKPFLERVERELQTVEGAAKYAGFLEKVGYKPNYQGKRV